jgi:hypothetical protein
LGIDLPILSSIVFATALLGADRMRVLTRRR